MSEALLDSVDLPRQIVERSGQLIRRTSRAEAQAIWLTRQWRNRQEMTPATGVVTLGSGVPRVDVPVLMTTGATGVGKSQVVSELSRLLDEKGIEHSRLDWDTLTNGPIAGQPAFVVDALGSVWDVHRRAGAVRLLLAASLERREMLSGVSAIEGARVHAFCLIAPPQEITARLRYRGSGDPACRHRTRERLPSRLPVKRGERGCRQAGNLLRGWTGDSVAVPMPTARAR